MEISGAAANETNSTSEPARLDVLGSVISATALKRRRKMRGNQTPLGGEPHEKLAERVGFPERVFAKPNVYNDFAIIPFDRNDLPFANHRRRLRPVAGVCRFWRLNGTRNDTRRGILTKFSRRVLARHKELIAL